MLERSGGGSDFADEVIADRMTKEFADVAQLVEQLIRNQQVNGSSPFVGSILSITCQSVDRRLVSNWSPSDFGLQFLHGFMGRFRSCLDVEALRGAHILMPQNALDRRRRGRMTGTNPGSSTSSSVLVLFSVVFHTLRQIASASPRSSSHHNPRISPLRSPAKAVAPMIARTHGAGDACARRYLPAELFPANEGNTWLMSS